MSAGLASENPRFVFDDICDVAVVVVNVLESTHIMSVCGALLIVSCLPVVLRKFCGLMRASLGIVETSDPPILHTSPAERAVLFEASALKVLATVGTMLFHFSYDEPVARDELKGVGHEMVLSLSIVCTDIFFVTSTFLSEPGCMSFQTSKIFDSDAGALLRLRLSLVHFEAALLRRFLRMAPSFIIQAVVHNSCTLLDRFLFLSFSVAVGGAWPWGVQFLCMVVVKFVYLLSALVGKSFGLASTVLLLACCIQRHHAVGPLVSTQWEFSAFRFCCTPTANVLGNYPHDSFGALFTLHCTFQQIGRSTKQSHGARRVYLRKHKLAVRRSAKHFQRAGW